MYLFVSLRKYLNLFFNTDKTLDCKGIYSRQKFV